MRAQIPTALILLGLFVVVGMDMTAQTTRRAVPIGLTPEHLEILAHMEIVHLEDGQGGLAKTIRIRGVNVQIVSGSGATNGHPANPSSVDPALTSTNGLGNLIVGYNEPGNPIADDRTGSHNIFSRNL